MSWKRELAAMTVVTFAAVLIGTPAAAESGQPDYGRPGIYLGIGAEGGAYTEVEDEVDDAIGGGADVDPAAGFDVFAGYRILEYVAAEVEFEMLPEAEIDVSGFGEVAKVETWVFTGNVKAFPIEGRIQPFAIVGIGALHAKLEDSVGANVDESDAGFAARFGAGVDFYATEQIVVFVRSTYVLPTGDVDDFDYVSFGGGLQVRF